MSGRVHCPPDCTCRGTRGAVLTPGHPAYDAAVARALDRVAEVIPFGRCFQHGDNDDGCNVIGCAFRKQ